MLLSLGVYAAGAFFVWSFIKITRFFWTNARSPLHELQGPIHDSGISLQGDFHDQEDTYGHTAKRIRWFKKYGSTFAVRGLMGKPTMMTSDPVALNSILSSYKFPRPQEYTYMLGQIVGQGLVVVNDDIHQKQRKIMSPAFGAPQIRELTGSIVEVAASLEAILSSRIISAGGEFRADMLMWFNRTALEMIGVAGFGYKFNALADTEPTELDSALEMLIKCGSTIFALIQALIPIFRIIPTSASRQIKKAHVSLNKIGRQLLTDAKATAMHSSEHGTGSVKDLLSLLVHVNLASDGQKLSDEEVIAQVPTFFIAGYETTSTMITWTLFALAQAPEVQKKLRKELRGIHTNTPTMDQLNSLPYLENIIREISRLYPAGPSIQRCATEDIIIPVSEPYFDQMGKQRSEIRMAKGDNIIIPIMAIHRLEDIWGPDASEFNPDRWNSISDTVKAMPGLHANLLTFVYGPRSCIGYRFAMIEWKAVLFALLRTLEFTLAVPPEDMGSVTDLTHHPYLLSDPSKQHQLPLIVKFAAQEDLSSSLSTGSNNA